MAIIKLFHVVLLVLLLGIVIFDGKTRRIPNRVTHLLLVTGVFLNFPGTPFTWLMTVLLVLGWKMGGIGGGDVKLWLALLWITIRGDDSQAAAIWALSFISTGLFQLGWRWVRKQPVLGVRSPGAWRMLPYACYLILVI